MRFRAFRLRVALAVAGCAFGTAAGAETLAGEIGPVELKGLHEPGEGPGRTVPLQFAGPAWIRGFSVSVVDAAGRSADDAGVFCHMSVKSGARRRKTGGLFAEPLHLTAAEGQNRFVLPEGFAIAVSSQEVYSLDAMLQSADSRKDGAYSFRYRIDAVSRQGRPSLKALTGYAVGLDRFWQVPSGRHVYEQEFRPTYSGGVHFLAFHIHQYVAELSLIDAASGRELYRATVDNRPDGWPRSVPSYSSLTGIPLVAGRRYVYRMVVDNPLERSVAAMSIARLYVHRQVSDAQRASRAGRMPPVE